MSQRSPIPPRVAGLCTFAMLAAIIFLAFSGLFRKPFEPDYRTVTAVFERAPQLHTGDQVRLEGQIEGKVGSIETAPDGNNVAVALRVKREAGPIYRDAHARIGFKTLLGGKFYVDLSRGTPATGQLGNETIDRRHTSVQHEIEDLTSIIQNGAVPGLQRLPGELAQALSRPDAPARAIEQLDQIAPSVSTATRAVRGKRPGTDLPEVVDAASAAVRALDAPQDELQRLVSGATATVAVTSRRRTELQRALAAGPGVTAELRTTGPELRTTLGLVRGLVSRLEGPAPDVAPTLAALRPALEGTTALLRAAQPVVDRLPATLDTLRAAGGDLERIIPALRPTLQQVDDVILPYFGRPDPGTGKSTTVMIGGTAAGFGGAASQQDQNGHFIRFPASLGASSAYLPCSTGLTDAYAKGKLACDGLNTVVDNYLGYFPKTVGGAAKGAK
ncbi:MAG: MCE family protein [Solirubrobacterales bacterium]|nr:MCE family protein [Solirubrobacterales bacterium]